MERQFSQAERWQVLVNELNDQIAEAQTGEAALWAGLRFTLHAVGFSAGLLAVQRPGEEAPWRLFPEEIPPAWQTQLTSPNTPLLQLLRRVIVGGDPVIGDSRVGLAAAIPLLHPTGLQGALLLPGPTLSADLVDALLACAPILARTAKIARETPPVVDRKRELQSMQMMAKILESNPADQDLQLHLLFRIRELLFADESLLVVLDQDQEGWIFRKIPGSEHTWGLQEGIRLEPGVASRCIESGLPIRLEGEELTGVLNPAVDVPPGMAVRSLLCCPLVAGGKTIGAVAVFNKEEGAFSEADQQLLLSVATALANATYNVRLIQQLRLANADLEASRFELLRSRNTLRALFDNLPSSIYIVDRRYTLIAINMSRADRAGAHPNAVVGRKCYQALFQRSEPCPGCRVSDTLFGGQTTSRVERSRIQQDQMMEWEIVTYPIYDQANEPVQAILIEQDVTEKRRLEANLAQSEKLAAVGQLAAGVAHEINNPLAAIIANAQILERDLPPDTDLQESVKLIQLAGSRASQVVRNLLGFARKEHYEYTPTDLNETIHSALFLLQHEFVRRPIDLIFDLADDLPPLIASKDHLQGVWLNLLMNAFDALEGKPGEVRIITRKQGNEFRITVADTGKGIPADKLTRIFEPFYTTKEAGRGTGLGLSLCHRIVKQHGGTISVESQVGQGTKFLVVLPSRQN